MASTSLSADEWFGYGLSLNAAGDRLAVGAYQGAGFGDVLNDSGEVYLFTFVDTQFAGGLHVATLGAGHAGGKNFSPALGAIDRFGTSVALNAAGDRLAVGAEGGDGASDASNGSGDVYLFTFDDGGGTDVTANYDITFVTDTTGEITPRPITVMAVSDTKVYDATTSSTGVPTVTVGQLAPGQTGIFTQVFDTPDAGTGKTLTPSGTIEDGGGTDVTANYVIIFAADTSGVIDPLAIELTVDPASKVYGETDPALSVSIASGAPAGGDTLTEITGTLSREAGENVGAYDIQLGTGAKAANYDITFVADNNAFTITQRTITVTAVADSKEYDGTVSSDGTPTIGGLGLASGDAADFSQVFDNRNVGTGKTLTASGSVLQGTTDVTANYDITFATTAGGEITPRAITVAGTAGQNKFVGDPDPAFTFGPIGGTSLATGDSFTGDIGRDPGEDVGTYAYTQGTLAIDDGNGGANYVLTFDTAATAFAIIEPTDLTPDTKDEIETVQVVVGSGGGGGGPGGRSSLAGGGVFLGSNNSFSRGLVAPISYPVELDDLSPIFVYDDGVSAVAFLKEEKKRRLPGQYEPVVVIVRMNRTESE